MKNAANDNFELSFIMLSAATRNVTRYLKLDEQKNEDAGSDTNSSCGDEKRAREQRRYIETRLRELAAFERRVNGGRKQN